MSALFAKLCESLGYPDSGACTIESVCESAVHVLKALDMEEQRLSERVREKEREVREKEKEVKEKEKEVREQVKKKQTERREERGESEGEEDEEGGKRTEVKEEKNEEEKEKDGSTDNNSSSNNNSSNTRTSTTVSSCCSHSGFRPRMRARSPSQSAQRANSIRAMRMWPSPLSVSLLVHAPLIMSCATLDGVLHNINRQLELVSGYTEDEVCVVVTDTTHTHHYECANNGNAISIPINTILYTVIAL